MLYFVLDGTNSFGEMMKIQEKNLENTYFCEAMFSHFDHLLLPQEAKQEAIKDLVSVADGIIVVGSVTEDMSYVLDFADEINMEVVYIENTE